MKSKMAIATLVSLAILATLVSVAVWRGQTPVVGSCSGKLPQGDFTVYRGQAPDGNCLQGYVWQASGPVRTVVIAVHGLHDHARRYDVLAKGLAASGVAVLAQDHRGHGGSGGAPQRLDSLEQLLSDVDLARAQAAKIFPDVPQILYGHSLGGMVAAQHAARNNKAWAGVVISSAALKLPPDVSPGKVRVVSALSAVAPELGLDAVDEAMLVREPSQRKAMADDSIIIRDKLPARTIGTLLNGVVDLQNRMPQITAPLLIFHGQRDQVTDPTGSSMLRDRAGSTEKTLRMFDNALHDLLHEPESSDLIQGLGVFIQARIKN